MTPETKPLIVKEHQIPQSAGPGWRSRVVQGAQMTVATWEASAGEAIDEHSHLEEQLFYVLHGEFEVTMNNVTCVATPGTFVLIPSGTPHSAKALTDAKLFDVNAPARADHG